MSEPTVSVVIPTRNREMRLRFVLEALAGQSLDPGRFEVIVVRADDTEGPLATGPKDLDAVDGASTFTVGRAAAKERVLVP